LSHEIFAFVLVFQIWLHCPMWTSPASVEEWALQRLYLVNIYLSVYCGRPGKCWYTWDHIFTVTILIDISS